MVDEEPQRFEINEVEVDARNLDNNLNVLAESNEEQKSCERVWPIKRVLKAAKDRFSLYGSDMADGFSLHSSHVHNPVYDFLRWFFEYHIFNAITLIYPLFEYHIFNATLASRPYLTETEGIHSRDGSAENLAILGMLVHQAHSLKSDVCVALLDMAKAFDRVSCSPLTDVCEEQEFLPSCAATSCQAWKGPKHRCQLTEKLAGR